MKKYLSTTETATVQNYPYGRLRTEATFAIEFNKNKGFRMLFQTVNPKNGVTNKPKATTYSPVMVLTDDNGFISTDVHSFYGTDGINKDCLWMAENFDLFTPEQIQDIYMTVITAIRGDIHGKVVYAGAPKDELMSLYKPALDAAVLGLREKFNTFGEIQIDEQAAKALEQPDFNPFTIREVQL